MDAFITLLGRVITYQLLGITIAVKPKPQVLVKDHIVKDKDPWEAVSPCHKTHRECWFIQCPTPAPFDKHWPQCLPWESPLGTSISLVPIYSCECECWLPIGHAWKLLLAEGTEWVDLIIATVKPWQQGCEKLLAAVNFFLTRSYQVTYLMPLVMFLPLPLIM